MSENRFVAIDGETIAYTLTRKSVKNITIRVRESGEVAVTAPTRTAIARIEEILRDKIKFVREGREKMQKKRAALPKPLQLVTGEIIPLFGAPHTISVLQDSKRRAGTVNGTLYLSVKNPDDAAERYRCFAEFSDATARAYFANAVAKALPEFLPKPPKMPTLCYRTMKTRWGACNYAKQKITFNRSLIFFPPPLIEYVIYHELAHFHHHDHSKAFWQFLTAKMPDCQARRKALNEYRPPSLAFEKA